jgi:hypothetical protein
MKNALYVLLIAVSLSACKTEAPKTEAEQREARASHFTDLLDRMVFGRHPEAKDLCIGYVSETRYASGSTNSAYGGPAMIEVDCAKVEHLLVNEAK